MRGAQKFLLAVRSVSREEKKLFIRIIGRFVAYGLDDDLKESIYAVIDGVDGRVHHLRLPDLNAVGDAAPGSIVELRRFEDAARRQRAALAVRSDLRLEKQVAAQGATWLDPQLVGRERL